MSEVTRRAFLKQGGVTAAAAGAAVAIPKSLMPKARPERTERPARQAHGTAAKREAERHLVVHVPDTNKSELRLMVGEREIVLRDRDLVARLVRATR